MCEYREGRRGIGENWFLHREGVKVILRRISHLRSSLDHANTPLVCNSTPFQPKILVLRCMTSLTLYQLFSFSSPRDPRED